MVVQPNTVRTKLILKINEILLTNTVNDTINIRTEP